MEVGIVLPPRAQKIFARRVIIILLLFFKKYGLCSIVRPTLGIKCNSVTEYTPNTLQYYTANTYGRKKIEKKIKQIELCVYNM